MSAGGAGARRLTPKLPTGPDGNNFETHAQFSPDGRRIIFVKTLGTRSAIFVVNLTGTGLRQLTSYSLGVDDRVDWSPDGSLILFSNARDDARGIPSNIYTIHPDGTGLTQITHERGKTISDKADSWSPNGKQIMFVRATPTAQSLYVMNANGTGMTQLTHGLRVHGGSWGTHP